MWRHLVKVDLGFGLVFTQSGFLRLSSKIRLFFPWLAKMQHAVIKITPVNSAIFVQCGAIPWRRPQMVPHNRDDFNVFLKKP